MAKFHASPKSPTVISDPRACYLDNTDFDSADDCYKAISAAGLTDLYEVRRGSSADEPLKVVFGVRSPHNSKGRVQNEHG